MNINIKAVLALASPFRAARGPTIMAAALVGATLLTNAPARAAPILYEAVLAPLSGSGVSGLATLSLDGSMLTVSVNASGLTPNEVHVQHIHGRFDPAGNPIDSVTPTLAQDTDGDGFIELTEGALTYGPIILELESASGESPTATSGGMVSFMRTFDLSDSLVFAGGFAIGDILPLTLREIVLHGRLLDAQTGLGFGPGEADGTAGYKAVLPVASGEIRAVAVPEPASLALFGAGLFGLGLVRRLRARQVR